MIHEAMSKIEKALIKRVEMYVTRLLIAYILTLKRDPRDTIYLKKYKADLRTYNLTLDRVAYNLSKILEHVEKKDL